MRNDNNKNMPNTEAREASKVLLLHSGDDSDSVSKLKTKIQNAGYKSENIFNYNINQGDSNGLDFVYIDNGTIKVKTDAMLVTAAAAAGNNAMKFHEMNKIVLFMPEQIASNNLSNYMSMYLNYWLAADENNGLVTLASYKPSLDGRQAPSDIQLGEAAIQFTGVEFEIGKNKQIEDVSTQEGYFLPKVFTLSNADGKKVDFLEDIEDAEIDTAIRDANGDNIYFGSSTADVSRKSYDYAQSVTAVAGSTVHIKDSSDEPFLISRKLSGKENDQFVYINIDADLIANSGNDVAEKIFTRAIDFAGHLDGCTQEDAANYDASNYHDALPEDGTCRYNKVTDIEMPAQGYTNFEFCLTSKIDVFDDNRPSKVTVDDLIDNTLSGAISYSANDHFGDVTLKKTDDTSSHLYGEDNKGYIHDASSAIVGSWEFSETKTEIVDVKESQALDSDNFNAIKALPDYIPYVSDTDDSNYNADSIGEYGALPVTYNLALHYSNEDSAKWDTNTEDDVTVYILLDLMEDIKADFDLSSKSTSESLLPQVVNWSLKDDRKMPGGVQNAVGEFNIPDPDSNDADAKLKIHSKTINLLTDKENVKLVNDELEVKFCFGNATRYRENGDLVVANDADNLDASDFKLSLTDIGGNVKPIDDDSAAFPKLDIAYAGCDDEEAYNYDSLTAFPINSVCEYKLCTNTNADNYNEFTHETLTFDDLEISQIVVDDSLCEINGCNDTNACNYIESEFDIVDDGSCAYTDLKLVLERNNNDADKVDLDHYGLPGLNGDHYASFNNIDTQGIKIKLSGPAECYDAIEISITNSGNTDTILLSDISNGVSYNENHILNLGVNEISLIGKKDGESDVPLSTKIVHVMRLQLGEGCQMDELPAEAKAIICIELGEYANNMYPAFANDSTIASSNALTLSELKQLYDNDSYDFQDWYPEIKTLFSQAEQYNKKVSECVGCTDSDKYGFSEFAEIDDGSCVEKVYGCTNQNAINYYPAANIDNDSCILPEEVVYGCMNVTSCNYDSNANQDDDSCINISVKLQNVVGNSFNDIANNKEFWAEDNEAIQEKDTDNKIHNLKFSIEDPEMFIHINKYQNELYNKEFTLDGSKLKFMHQTGDNKKIQIKTNDQWLVRGDYEFYQTVQYTKIHGGDSKPFNVKLEIDNFVWVTLIEEESTVVTLYNRLNSATLDLTMPADNARKSAAAHEISGCQLDTVFITNSDGNKINLEVLDYFDQEPILIQDIYSNGMPFTIPNESLELSDANDGTQDIHTHKYEFRSTGILLDELSIARYYSGCSSVTDSNHPLYNLDSQLLNEDTHVTYTLLSHKGSMHPLIAEYAEEFSCRLDLCNVPELSYSDQYGETITIEANNEDEKCRGGSGTEVDYICTPNEGTCDYSGCTSSYAKNYHPDVTTHDESKCMYVVCGDSNADNYAEDFSWVEAGMNTFEDNSLCKYKGCVDARATNYDSKHTLDEVWNTDSRACSFTDCYDSTACNYAENIDNLIDYYGSDIQYADHNDFSENTLITKPTFVHDDGLCKHPEINNLTVTSTKEYNGKNIVITPTNTPDLTFNGESLSSVTHVGNENVILQFESSALNSEHSDLAALRTSIGASLDLKLYSNMMLNGQNIKPVINSYFHQEDTLTLFGSEQTVTDLVGGAMFDQSLGRWVSSSVNSNDDNYDENLNVDDSGYDALLTMNLHGLGSKGIIDEDDANMKGEYVDVNDAPRWVKVPFKAEFSKQPLNIEATKDQYNTNIPERYFLKLTPILGLGKSLDIKEILIDLPDDFNNKGVALSEKTYFEMAVVNHDDVINGNGRIYKNQGSSGGRLAQQLLLGQCRADFFELSLKNSLGVSVPGYDKLKIHGHGSEDLITPTGDNPNNIYSLNISTEDLVIGDVYTLSVSLINEDLEKQNINSTVDVVEKYIVANKLGCTSTTSTQYIDESNVMEYTWKKYGSSGSTLDSCIAEGCLDRTATNYNGDANVSNLDLCKYADFGIDTDCAYNYSKDVNHVDSLSGWGKYKLFIEQGLSVPQDQEMPGQIENVIQFLGKDNYGDALGYNTLEDGVKVRVALSSEMQEILLDVKNSCNDTNAGNYNEANTNMDDAAFCSDSSLSNLPDPNNTPLETMLENSTLATLLGKYAQHKDRVAQKDQLVDIVMNADSNLEDHMEEDYYHNDEVNEKLKDQIATLTALIGLDEAELHAELAAAGYSASNEYIASYLAELYRIQNLSVNGNKSIKLTVWVSENGGVPGFETREFTRADMSSDKVEVSSDKSKVTLLLDNLPMRVSANGTDALLYVGLGELEAATAAKLNNSGVCAESYKLISAGIGREGCMNSNATADSYDVEAVVSNDDMCKFDGCTDPDAANYDEDANREDGSCQYYICSDARACNYEENPSAPSLVFNNKGFPVVWNGVAPKIADSTTSDPFIEDNICKIPELRLTEYLDQNLWASQAEGIEDADDLEVDPINGIRLEGKAVLLREGLHYEARDLLQTNITADQLIGNYEFETDFRKVAGSDTKAKYILQLNENNQAVLVPKENHDLGAQPIVASWEWNQKVKVDEVTGLKYQLRIAEDLSSSYKSRSSYRFFATLNSSSSQSLFSAKLVEPISEGAAEYNCDSFAISTEELGRHRMSGDKLRLATSSELFRIMCEDVDSLGLFKINDDGSNQFIQNIRTLSDDFNIPADIAIAGAPVKFEIKALNSSFDKDAPFSSDMEVAMPNETVFEIQYRKYGCADSSASNYMNITVGDNDNFVAHIYDPDMELCEYSGCLDSTACNYNPWATEEMNTKYGNDGLCDFDHCKQCLDTDACNYDADLEPYKFTGPASKGSWSADAAPWALSEDSEFCKIIDQCGECVYSEDENKGCDGCKDEMYDNYDANAIVHNQSLCVLKGCNVDIVYGLTTNNQNTNVTEHVDDMCGLLGCTDPEACNYDSNATVDDDSCQTTSITNLKIGGVSHAARAEGSSSHDEEQYTWEDTINVTFTSGIFKVEPNAINIIGDYIHETLHKDDDGNYTEGSVGMFRLTNIDTGSNSFKQLKYFDGSSESTGQYKFIGKNNSGNYSTMMDVLPGATFDQLKDDLINSTNYNYTNDDDIKYNVVAIVNNVTYYMMILDAYKKTTGYITNVTNGTNDELYPTVKFMDLYKDNGNVILSNTRVNSIGEKSINKSRVLKAKNVTLPTYDEAYVVDGPTACNVDTIKVTLQKQNDNGEYEEDQDLNSAGAELFEDKLVMTPTFFTGSRAISASEKPDQLPGVYKITLTGKTYNSDEVNKAHAEFEITIYSTNCGEESASNYIDTDDNLLIEEKQNKLGANGLPEQEAGSGYCTYDGCKDEQTACNYSPNFDTHNSVLCTYPDEFHNCAGVCQEEIVCGVCGGKSEELIDCEGKCMNIDGYENAVVHPVTGACVGGTTGSELEKDCGDSNACNYNAIFNGTALHDASLCSYPDNEHTDCSGNCIGDAIKDCAGDCGLVSEASFKVYDSCGVCDGNASMCDNVDLVAGWNNIGTDLSRKVNILDKDDIIESIWQWTSTGYTEFRLNNEDIGTEGSGNTSQVPVLSNVAPGTALWIRASEAKSIKLVRISLVEMNIHGKVDFNDFELNNKASPQVVQLEDIRINSETVIDKSFVHQEKDELDLDVVAGDGQEVLLHLSNINKEYKSGDDVDHVYLEVDGANVNLRFFNAIINEAGVISKVVDENDQEITSRPSGSDIVQIGNASDKVYIKLILSTDSNKLHDVNDIIMSIERANSTSTTPGSILINAKVSLFAPDAKDSEGNDIVPSVLTLGTN